MIGSLSDQGFFIDIHCHRAYKYSMKALIIESDNDIAVALGQYLESEGIEVESKVNNLDDIDYTFNNLRPDIVLVDTHVNGDTSTIIQKARSTHCKIAVMTTDPRLEIKDADYILRKPFDLDELNQIICNY